MKILLVLRHAKSSWNDSALADHERPLNARGVRDAPRMGELLREQHVMPDVIISSDAVRAQMTAEAVAKAARYEGQIVFDHLLYLAGVEDIVAVLQTIPQIKARTVMIVGHNPGLEELVARLSGERQEMPTAALAHIVLPIDQWRDLTESTRGALMDVWRPKEI